MLKENEVVFIFLRRHRSSSSAAGGVGFVAIVIVVFVAVSVHVCNLCHQHDLHYIFSPSICEHSWQVIRLLCCEHGSLKRPRFTATPW